MPDDDISAYVDTEDFIERVSDRRRKLLILVVLLSCILALMYFLSMFLGAVNVNYRDVIDVWFGNGTWAHTYIIETIRMPRVACAAVVGAGLSVAGMAMQSLFRNPMAAPSVLGLSSGAAFGAALAMGLGVGGFAGMFSVPLMAFVFCFITVFLVYSLAYTRFGVPTVLLLLSGIAVGTFFGGLTSMIQYLVDRDALANIIYWTMGSFGRCDWTSFKISLVTVGLGVGIIVACSRELNLISMGEEQAKTLGINIKVVRWALLIGTALCVGGSVAISGVIGFVGLIIPHVCRALIGPNHVYLWPICVLTGAIFLVTMDLISRTIFAASIGSLPVGVLTALVGAPFFVYVMRKKRNELWG